MFVIQNGTVNMIMTLEHFLSTANVKNSVITWSKHS